MADRINCARFQGLRPFRYVCANPQETGRIGLPFPIEKSSSVMKLIAERAVTLKASRTYLSPSFCPQYSQKEDKYEEEIKILTDKLKEVRDRAGLWWGGGGHLCCRKSTCVNTRGRGH